MIKVIQPRDLFNQTDRSVNRNNTVKMLYAPYSTDALQGMRCLDTMILFALFNIVDPHKFLEFGTGVGCSTYNLWLNFHHTEYYTIDTADVSGTLLGGLENVTRIIGDSRCVRSDPVSRYTFEGMFVDGGRDRETLMSDTMFCLEQYNKHTKSFIAWHDYGVEPEVAPYLHYLSKHIPICHVDGSLVAYTLLDPGGKND